MLSSLERESGFVSPVRSDFVHFTIPSARRYIPWAKSRIMTMIVFGRLFHIFHKYTLKLFGSQCIPLYSSTLISINSPIYVTLYSFSLSSRDSSFSPSSHFHEYLVLFFQVFLGYENSHSGYREYLCGTFFPLDTDRWDDSFGSFFSLVRRYRVVG